MAPSKSSQLSNVIRYHVRQLKTFGLVGEDHSISVEVSTKGCDGAYENPVRIVFHEDSLPHLHGALRAALAVIDCDDEEREN